MIGLGIGMPVGVLLFFLLQRFTVGLTKKGRVPILYGLLFALSPPAVLLAVAFLYCDGLLWTAVGMAAVLLVLGVFYSIRDMHRQKAEHEEPQTIITTKDGTKS